jgi:hypothetical protein
MPKEKKKFAETKIGKFLKEKAPYILDKVADILPDKGGLGIVKHLIEKDDKLTPQDKETALKELEMDMAEMEEITKRWVADVNSDSWLSKNARPLVLLSLVACMYVFIVLDSFYKISFDVSSEWIDVFKYVLMATITAYFGVRGAEKVTSMIRNTKK